MVVRNNELPPGDTEEKSERLDVNCNIDDDTQIDLEMQASRIQEDADGEHRNLKGKSIRYNAVKSLCYIEKLGRNLAGSMLK